MDIHASGNTHTKQLFLKSMSHNHACLVISQVYFLCHLCTCEVNRVTRYCRFVSSNQFRALDEPSTIGMLLKFILSMCMMIAVYHSHSLLGASAYVWKWIPNDEVCSISRCRRCASFGIPFL